MSVQDIEFLASATSWDSTQEALSHYHIPVQRRTEIEEAFREFNKVPTLQDVERHFQRKIETLEEEIRTINKEKEETLKLAGKFWHYVKKHRGHIRKKLGRHGPRPRKVKSGRRPP